MRSIVVVLVIVSWLEVATSTARANSEIFAAFGGGISGVGSHTSGFHQSLELTVGWLHDRNDKANPPMSLMKVSTVAISAGTIFHGRSIEYTYGEVATFVPLLALLGPLMGIGAGRLVETGSRGEPAVHASLGLFLPLQCWFGASSAMRAVYLEPYYRPQIGLSNGRAAHELGLLLKVLMINT